MPSNVALWSWSRIIDKVRGSNASQGVILEDEQVPGSSAFASSLWPFKVGSSGMGY